MSKFIPDFSAIGKTNWSKPNFDTRNPFWWVMVGATLLMVVFVFIPWQTVTVTSGPISETASRLGITTWFGVLGLLSALLAVYGVLYNQKQFAFCGALLATVWALVGCFTIVDVTKDGVTVTAEQIEAAIVAANATIALKFGVNISVGHTGALLFLIASLVLALVSFLQIKKENK
jgi:hypothetical protein